MRSLDEIRARTPKSELFRGQIQHAMIAALLTIGTCSLLINAETTYLTRSPICWAYIAMAIALFHQSMVAVVFRAQLHLNLMVRLFGDNALKIWGAMFLPFLALRPITVLIAGLADAGSLAGDRTLQLATGAILMIPAIWGMHSVIKHFTINRALGGDHFYDKYANMPMVTQGIFKYSSNAMYSFVFLGLWAIALLTGSWNAIVLALFNHAYIWVHMYCTEDPDMKIIYGDSRENQ
ncbi:MAG: PEMT/PEM2 methyltransferase family protein [Paracoccaceae bacterium]